MIESAAYRFKIPPAWVEAIQSLIGSFFTWLSGQDLDVGECGAASKAASRRFFHSHLSVKIDVNFRRIVLFSPEILFNHTSNCLFLSNCWKIFTNAHLIFNDFHSGHLA